MRVPGNCFAIGRGTPVCGVVMKVLAISYMADFGALLPGCRRGAIASRVELAGRILILVCALPIIEEL